jgi:hypothetical protein
MADNTNGNTAATPPAAGTATNAAPATPAAQEEQRLRGVSRSLLIAVGGTGHKILLDVGSGCCKSTARSTSCRSFRSC